METSLPTKYRPQNLDEIIGNKNIIESLSTILEREKGLPASFLLYGPSGCGKTTLARIIAKELGASKKDIKELNISNTRGIDAARNIIENCKYTPIGGNKKVIVLNEVHKATNEFQNAMLEIIEEPPRKVHFILCTTEPEKLLKTIRTRCSEYRVSELTSRDIIILLNSILKKEEINNFPKEAIKKIAGVSEGCPREALKILDTVIDIEDDEKLIETIEKFTTNEKTIKELCQAFLQGKKWPTIAKIVKNMNDEPETIRRAVLNYMSVVLLGADNPDAAIIIECFTDNYFSSGKAGLILSCYYVATRK